MYVWDFDKSLSIYKTKFTVYHQVIPSMIDAKCYKFEVCERGSGIIKE